MVVKTIDTSVPHPWLVSLPDRSIGDRFQLLGPLARGGSAEVYRARDLDTGDVVALKLLRPELRSDPTHRAQLLQEARVSASLPLGVAPTPVCTGDDTALGAFYAMELVDAEPLSTRIARAVMSFDEVARVAESLVRAVSAVHAAGYVHCDVKPANVLWSEERGLRLIDFGVACAVAPRATETDGLFGTPGYMAPEQFHGADSTASDQFGIAATIFACLVGCAPYTVGRGARPLCTLLLHQGVELTPRESGALGRLGPWVARAMRVDPLDRYTDTADMAAALVRMTPSRSRFRVTWSAGRIAARSASALLVALAALIVFVGANH